MGAIGLGLILYDLSKDRLAINMRTYLRLILYALVVSFVGYVSITLNNTPIMSMLLIYHRWLYGYVLLMLQCL